MIRCTTIGIQPSPVCYEICVLAYKCGALKAWERENAERKNHEQKQAQKAHRRRQIRKAVRLLGEQPRWLEQDKEAKQKNRKAEIKARG